MSYTDGLKIRDIFHFRYGICQMVHFSRTNCWVGLNEKKQALWAPDKNGHPDMDRVRKPQYLYHEQVTFLQVLNFSFEPECSVIDYVAATDRETDIA